MWPLNQPDLKEKKENKGVDGHTLHHPKTQRTVSMLERRCEKRQRGMAQYKINRSAEVLLRSGRSLTMGYIYNVMKDYSVMEHDSVILANTKKVQEANILKTMCVLFL